MALPVLILCTCILMAGMAPAAHLGIHSMVVGDRALELVENRQLTFHNDGRSPRLVSPRMGGIWPMSSRRLMRQRRPASSVCCSQTRRGPE